MRDLEAVMQALTAHASRAAEKLRLHGLVAGQITAFFTQTVFKNRAALGIKNRKAEAHDE
nr:hypothetical protein [Klebsiella pneumoniae]